MEDTIYAFTPATETAYPPYFNLSGTDDSFVVTVRSPAGLAGRHNKVGDTGQMPLSRKELEELYLALQRVLTTTDEA